MNVVTDLGEAPYSSKGLRGGGGRRGEKGGEGGGKGGEGGG